MKKYTLVLAIAALLVVIAVGMVATNFTVYLGDDPTACNNCHVMDAVYEGWYHSSHRLWASCNDCHTPHDFIAKYLVKAQSGINHVSAFTFGEIPDAIRAKPSSQAVIQANCIRCHAATVEDIGDGQMDSERYCFECHRSEAHGERGISILPYQDRGTWDAVEGE